MNKLYMLDTNICIYIMNNQPPHVAHKFSQFLDNQIVISSITFAELAHGAKKHRRIQQLESFSKLLPILKFDEKASLAYADIALISNRQKNVMDKLIASHAIAINATLVTNNEKDFLEFGLELENWV